MNAVQFVKTLKSLNFENTFNPYSNTCEIFDTVDAASQRAEILLEMLEAASKSKVDAIWIARDLGHRGGRRTGLALTDDVHIEAHAKRWGVKAKRATKGSAVAERTSAIIWSMLSRINENIFLWNVFPLHPHEENEPFSNRLHNKFERAAGEELLENLISLLNPKRLIAIGNDAEKTAMRISNGIPVYKVRHPSYGGHIQYTSQITQLYDLEEESQGKLQIQS